MSNNTGASSSSSSSSSSSRVSIPNSVRKTIQHIKEITSNHSEEDIYSMLRECSMDPNETTQRLLHLDSFHEVKRKRDKRKETVKIRPNDDSRWKPGHQGRGTRNARGNSYSQYTSNGAGGQRTAAIRKENGVEESKGRGFRHPPAPISKETDSIQSRNLEKSSFVIVDGPLELPNGVLSGGHVGQSTCPPDNKIDASADNAGIVMPKVNAENAHSASDPVLVPPCDLPVTADGSIKQEVRIQHMSADTSTPALAVRENHLNQHEPQNVDSSLAPSSTIECPSADKSHVSDSVTAVKPSGRQGVKGVTRKLEKLRFSDGEHVIIPQHIQVPDAVKNVLSFGSLDACFEVRENCVVACENNENFNLDTDSVHEETVSKLSSCDQDAVSTAPQANHADHSQPPSHIPGNNSPIDTEVSSSATAPNDDQPKKETLPAVGPPFPVVQTAPSYTFGFMPPMLGNMLVQPEGVESQAHVSNSLSGSSMAVSTSASTPPLTQSGAGQSSAAASPQPIPVFRHPYPPNYIPYSHYFSPFYVPPTMHQYYGHTAFPPPLPTGNMYLPPPTAAGPAAGVKISPHFKPGANTGNQGPVGVPSGYGAYSTAQVGYSQNAAAAMTSGNSSNGEDAGAPALKESNIFAGQQSEGSAAWLHPAAGRDTTSFPLNPFLNLPQQGQHILSPQSGHGGFALYHALQPMGGPAPGLPMLQQSQPVAGSVESVGPPSNSFQQPQRQQQINWNM